MAQIEITKQPLYGSVYWNGYDFVYTPNNGYKGSDVYFYKIIRNGVSSTGINYVNVQNTAPISLNPTLTSDAFKSIIINLNQLATDDTNPFNDLKISEVSNPTRGRIENNGDSIRYIPDTYNTVETINYTISDKQFSTNGVLTLSVINGKTLSPSNQIQTFKYKLIRYYEKLLRLPELSSNWESAYYNLSTYKDYWSSIDISRYIRISNYVESISSELDSLYDNRFDYNLIYSIVSANSGLWISDRNVIDVVKNNEVNLNDVNDILFSRKDAWDADYINFSGLSSDFNDNTPIFNDFSQTILDNINNWNSNEIYHNIENNRYKWDATYEQLYTNGKLDEWNNTVTNTNTFSSEYTSVTSDTVKFYSSFNTITSLSTVWGNLETEAIMISSDNWNAVENASPNYNNVYNIVSGASAEWISDISKSEEMLILSLFKSGDWNQTYDIVTDYSNNWDQLDLLNEPLSTNEINYNSLYNTLTTFSGNWDIESILSYFESHYYLNNDLYDIINNNTDIWNSNFNTITALSSDLENLHLNDLYNLIGSQSSVWDLLANSYEFVLLSGGDLSAFNNNRTVYDSLYSILCSNSSVWYKDIQSLFLPNSSNWINTYDVISGDALTNWYQLSSLNEALSTSEINYNSLYNTLTTSSGNWDSESILSYFANNYYLNNDLYDAVNIVSNNFTSISDLSSDLSTNILHLDNLYNLISSQSSAWDLLANSYGFVLLSGGDLSAFNDNRSAYDNLYSILCSNSSVWYKDVTFINTLSSYLFENSPKWIILNDIVAYSNWAGATNTYELLSSIISENNTRFDEVNTTVENNSSKWTGVEFINTLSSISAWTETTNALIGDPWNINNNLTSLSSNYYSLADKLNPLNLFIDDRLPVWTSQTLTTILTGNSSKWYSTYDTVTSYSSGWDFNNKPEYTSTYNYVSSNSAKLTNLTNLISTNSGDWNKNVSAISELSSIYLSGSNDINLSALNLEVYGSTFITGNLSANGTKVSIDTTLNTTSSFSINNTNNTTAVSIDKTGVGAIFNVRMPDSTVLYVKASPPTVGINLSAFTNVIGDVSNISLVISGNLSATGEIYPVPDAVTSYKNLSSRYESTYTYVTGISSNIISFITNDKPRYDAAVIYVNSGGLNSFSNTTIPYYNGLLPIFSSYSSKVTSINNLIALSGSKFDVDTVFSSNSSKYETIYSYVTAKTSSTVFTISHFYNHSKMITAQDVNIILDDNIRIKSWVMASDVNTTANIDILSCSYSDFAKFGYPVSITNNNYPNITLSTKNSATNLNSTWSNTYLPKGSVLQFKLKNNTDATKLLINLAVEKQ